MGKTKITRTRQACHANCLSLSSDEESLFLGLSDGDVAHYSIDPTNFKLSKIEWFMAHQEAINGMEISGNKKALATCSSGAVSNLRLWLDDTKRGTTFGTKMDYKLFQDITIESGPVNSIRISNDLKTVVSGDSTGTI